VKAFESRANARMGEVSSGKRRLMSGRSAAARSIVYGLALSAIWTAPVLAVVDGDELKQSHSGAGTGAEQVSGVGNLVPSRLNSGAAVLASEERAESTRHVVDGVPQVNVDFAQETPDVYVLTLNALHADRSAFSLGKEQMSIAWGDHQTDLRVAGVPGPEQLMNTAISSMVFEGAQRKALTVTFDPNYAVSFVSNRQSATDIETLVVRFESRRPRMPLSVEPNSNGPGVGQLQAHTGSVARGPQAAAAVCSEPADTLLPRPSNAGCRAIPLPVEAPAEPNARGSQGSALEYGDQVSDTETSDFDALVAAKIVEARITVPRPQPGDYALALPVPDRWRVLGALGEKSKWYDPYNQNTLKADLPVRDDWFFNLTAISDTFYENRTVPTPVGLQSTDVAGSNNVFGSFDQSALIENVALEFVYYKGDTVFKPVDWEFRFTPVFNINYTRVDEILGVNADPGEGETRWRTDIGIQSAFVDKHLWNVSDNYDFDSVRFGIQPFSSDFRGFLFQDSPFGMRLFGNRWNNKVQYNLAWFRRLDKDVNSGLNDVDAGLRDDDVFVANVYWQDMPRLGFFSEFLFAYNRNRETKTTFDDNNFIARPASIGLEKPRTYDAYYVGLGGDGHFGRLNLTTQFYWVTGKEEDGLFTGVEADIDGLFFAAEPSIDMDWLRLKLSFLYASGDSDPYDDKSEAFDAIFENPIFAGADTSYWIRQAVPLIGGGRVTLSGRNGLLNSMRSSKEQGQSNFTNPGLILYGIGADADVLPQLRVSFNANYLRFADTAVLKVARATTDINEEIGIDLSASLIWRPFMTQNIVFRASYASLIAGRGYADLYGEKNPYSFLANMVFTW